MRGYRNAIALVIGWYSEGSLKAWRRDDPGGHFVCRVRDCCKLSHGHGEGRDTSFVATPVVASLNNISVSFRSEYIYSCRVRFRQDFAG